MARSSDSQPAASESARPEPRSAGESSKSPSKPPGKGGRRGRPPTPPDVARGRILDAAERCFERAPLADVKVAEIVAEAGMSSRSFYQLFEDKFDVAASLAEVRVEEHAVAIQKLVDEARTVLEGMGAFLYFMMDHVPMPVGELDVHPGRPGQRIRVVRDRYRAAVTQVVLGGVSRVQSEGLIEGGPQPFSVMLVLSGLENIAMTYLRERRRDELRALQPDLLQAIRTLFPQYLAEDIPLD